MYQSSIFWLINFKLCAVLQWPEKTCGQLGQKILCCQGRPCARLSGRLLSLWLFQRDKLNWKIEELCRIGGSNVRSTSEDDDSHCFVHNV